MGREPAKKYALFIPQTEGRHDAHFLSVLEVTVTGVALVKIMVLLLGMHYSLNLKNLLERILHTRNQVEVSGG